MNAPYTMQTFLHGTIDDGAPILVRSLERRRLQCYLALMLTDIAALFIGFGVPGLFTGGADGVPGAFLLASVVLPIFLTIAFYNGSYSIDALRQPSLAIVRSEVALLISATAVVFVSFYTKSGVEFSRAGFTFGMACSVLTLFVTRLEMRRFVGWRCGADVINQLVIEDGGPHIELPGAIRLSAPAHRLAPTLHDPHALDRFGLALRNIDRVIVSCPRERRAGWALMLKGANVEGEVLDDEVVRLGAQGARVTAGHGLLLVSAGPLGVRARMVKRLFDLTFAVSALLVLSPLLLAVAMAIRFEDGGPVFFVQRRMGRGNRFFDILKFRSMTVAQADGAGHVSASKTDKRITRVGRFIRSTSIDELPQLINVLKGDMSLVGPRPHAIGSQAGSKLFWEVDSRYWQRHCLKPGLSGLAQVRGFRGATECESDLTNRLQSDLEYLEGWTIMRDIRILLLTLRVLVHDRAF